ncbi:MAG: hypothetical protein P1P88_25730, partial [Bacteroidales bacterium]|nr:hypothetical protein [Bacteroidales bacterium]
MKTKIKSVMLVILIVSIGVIFSSCKKTDEQNPAQPELPPSESFILPMDGFLDKTENIAQKSYLWFGVSAIYVGVWNSIIGINLAVPIASFKEAIKHERIQVNENLWRWSYDFTAISTVYKAELEASTEGDLVKWDMYISKTGNGSFSRFKWFTGISAPDGTGGYWIMYQSPTDNNEMYEIVWHKNYKIGTSDITYTNILNNDNNEDSYINFTNNKANNYDAIYVIYESAEDKIIEIQWNSLATF